jgi:hypothetical protein
MNVWIVILKVLGYIWVTLGMILILIGIVGIWIKGGFSAVQELMSPFNVTNYVAIIITLAPGLGALAWAKKLENKQINTHKPSNP